MSQTIEDLEPIIHSHLNAIKALFKPGFKATLVLRNPRLAKKGLGVGVLVVSDDDPEAVARELLVRR